MGSLELAPGARVCVDTQFCIYLVERNPKFCLACDAILRRIVESRASLIVSELAIHECLVLPLRNKDVAAVERYETFFAQPSVNCVPVDRTVLRAAAAIRAEHLRIRSPDAIHIATAAAHSAAALITNDHSWSGCTITPLVYIDSWAESAPRG